MFGNQGLRRSFTAIVLRLGGVALSASGAWGEVIYDANGFSSLSVGPGSRASSAGNVRVARRR